MGIFDFISWVVRAITTSRLRTALTALGIAIGISAVTLLTSIGEGLRLYLMDSFSQFGTRIIAVTPGKTDTQGLGGILNTVRPLSLNDAEALSKLQHVEYVVPVVQGTGRIEAGKFARNANLFAVNHELDKAWRINVALGRFLPADNPRSARSFAVLGAKLKTELFGNANPLGEFVRIGGARFRVIGVMESKGQLLGFDLDDVAYIPIGRGLELFNREGLMEIDVIFSEGTSSQAISRRISQTLIQLHGREDFTLFTQEDMLSTMNNILNFIKYIIGALGSISLIVGGVGVLTIMTTSMRERTQEIGLLRAVGTTKGQILGLFLGEAICLAVLGGLLGLVLLLLFFGVLKLAAPGLPLAIQPIYLLLSLALSALIGLLAGIGPAHTASNLNPIDALRSE